MCGISGIYSFRNFTIDKNMLMDMTRLIHHRGPDGEGIYNENNLGIGSTRLSIIDLREISNMPLEDIDGRYLIVYNGEIFNYVEIRNELVSIGHQFKTTSDTEVILNAYKEWGQDCLHRLNGMWAFAIWDKKNKSLFCARDRYGIKPFYYCRDSESFFFGSEIKQLLNIVKDKSLNDKIIYDYLIYNFIDHTSETFYQNIQKLPAGYKIFIDNNNFKIEQWYHLRENIIDSTDENAIYKKLYELIYDSVRIRLRSDVEVGSCLSGGLDSSTIVCTMHDILHNEGKPEIQKTYTAVYDIPELDERKYVEDVIRQTNSTKYYLQPDADELIKDLDNLYYHQDEPFTSLSIYAQYCVFKKIHETNLKVVLDGQGADEILLGYASFYPFFLKRYFNDPVKFIKEFKGGADVSRLGVNKFIQNLVYFNSPAVRFKHVNNNAALYLNSEFQNSLDRKDLFHSMISGDLSDNRMSNLWKISLPSLLRYEDKNSMAFSVEARLPFLDHRLVEFIFTIPFQQLIKNGWTKYALRKAAADRIPESIVWRKGKLAFSVPQKLWMYKLRDYIEKNFKDEFMSEEYIDKDKFFRQLRSDNFNDKLLFRVFSLEKWMRIFNLK